MLAMTGRVTMLGLSRWTEKGGSYRTIQRFFNSPIRWAKVNWFFIRHHLLGRQDTILLGGDESVAAVEAAAAAAGERLWRLPLPSDYRKKIDSDVADMKNTGPRYGGAINAALLLKEFVGDIPWAHLDIAGPARAADTEHYVLEGGTGFGVRTIVALAAQMAAD